MFDLSYISFRLPINSHVFIILSISHRELVSSYKPLYDKNRDENFRNNLAQEIVRKLRPGRFLKMHSTDYYWEIDHESAVKKVSCMHIGALKRCGFLVLVIY